MRLFFPISIALLITGGLLRLISFGVLPTGLYMDEAAIGADAYMISQTGNDMHGNSPFQPILPSYGDFKAPVYVWIASLVTLAIGSGEIAVRAPSLLAGLLSLFLASAIAKMLFPKVSGLAWISMVVVAVMPWSILFSRTGFEGHMGQALMGLSILSLLHGLSSTRSRVQSLLLLVLSAVLGSLSVYTYYSIRYVLPVVVLIVVALFNQKTAARTRVFHAILWFLIWSATMIPMFTHPLYQESERFRLSARSVLQDMPLYVEESNQLRAQAGDTMIARLMFHRYWFMVRALAENYAEQLSLSFLFSSGDQNLRHGTGTHGLAFLTMAPFFLIGIGYGFSLHPKMVSILLMWFVTAMLPAAVPHEVPHALRALNGLLPFAILIALGVARVAQHPKRTILLSAATLLLLFEISAFAYQYFHWYPARSADAWEDGMREMIVYGEELHQQNPDSTLVYYGHEKAFLWYILYLRPDPQLVTQSESTLYRKLEIGGVRFHPEFTDLDQTSSVVLGTGEQFDEFGIEIRDEVLGTQRSGYYFYTAPHLSTLYQQEIQE